MSRQEAATENGSAKQNLHFQNEFAISQGIYLSLYFVITLSFADAWPRAIETEIGAALCAIGAGSTLTLTLL